MADKALTPEEQRELAGPNIMLMGPPGSGKTTSIQTLVDCGIDTNVIFLENGLEVLVSRYAEQGRPIPENLHWQVIKGPKKTFATLKANADKVLTMDQKSLANMNDVNRAQHNLFNNLLEGLANFRDDRTGELRGAVDEWPADRVLVIDGLTGISRAAMSMVVGGKPMASQPDWGIAMGQVETFIQMCCDNCECWFVLIAHVERETDNVLGGIKLMPSTLGQKLPPKLPGMFSDVIKTVREGTSWSWDTIDSQADVKARNLPWAKGLKPDFKQIYDSWVKRRNAILASK